jgi:hypothetical protein
LIAGVTLAAVIIWARAVVDKARFFPKAGFLPGRPAPSRNAVLLIPINN